MTTWALILAIYFSAWSGTAWYSWDTHGEYILPGVWIGPGVSPGFVAYKPDSAYHSAVLGWWWGPREACPSAGCANQTTRNVFVEIIGQSQPVQALAGQWVRIRWVALTGADGELAAIVWQSFGASLPVAEHRIYSCPAQPTSSAQWVEIGCDLFLPTAEGLVITPGSYSGCGLALPGEYGPDAIQVQSFEVSILR